MIEISESYSLNENKIDKIFIATVHVQWNSGETRCLHDKKTIKQMHKWPCTNQHTSFNAKEAVLLYNIPYAHNALWLSVSSRSSSIIVGYIISDGGKIIASFS